MRKLGLAFVLAVALGAAACSAGVATDNVATLDAQATEACARLYQLVQAQAVLPPRDLRDRLGQIYAHASASVNPVIRARAVALYAHAAQIAEGADWGSFRAELSAMQQACGAPSS